MRRFASPARFTPLVIDLTRVACLVVGGGRVATRKIETLVAGGARVAVVSPKVSPRISALARSGRISIRRRGYAVPDVRGYRLVVAATDDAPLNGRIGREAHRAGALACVTSSARDSSLIFPAVVRRGRVTVSVHTGGSSPAVSRSVRTAIGTAWTSAEGAR